jgi:hypothetical protein
VLLRRLSDSAQRQVSQTKAVAGVGRTRDPGFAVWDDLEMSDELPQPGELPIACTLEVVDGAARMARWRALSGARVDVRHEPDQVVVVYEPRSGVHEELEALVAAERECCAFAEWEVTQGPKSVVLRIRADAQGLASIVAAFPQ